MRNVVVETNREIAAQLGINQAVATTCVKPSGNSSLLLDCSSGIHARWSTYYTRNIRINTFTPIFKVLQDARRADEPRKRSEPRNRRHLGRPFPGQIAGRRDHAQYALRARAVRVLAAKQDPLDGAQSQCDDHLPSHEVLDIIKWVWENQHQINGMTFLPTFDAQYDQMPYVEITKEEYEQNAAAFPAIDFSKIWRYEDKDLTTAAQEVACSAGACDLILDVTRSPATSSISVLTSAGDFCFEERMNETTILRVMSFNIRYNNPNDGDNAWPYRKEMAASMVHLHRPDVMGLQEVLGDQLEDLATRLPDFRVGGRGPR